MREKKIEVEQYYGSNVELYPLPVRSGSPNEENHHAKTVKSRNHAKEVASLGLFLSKKPPAERGAQYRATLCGWQRLAGLTLIKVAWGRNHNRVKVGCCGRR